MTEASPNIYASMSVLVVDDFDSMRRIISTLLTGIGFKKIEVAEDGAKALGKLDLMDYDFIVTDWNMPNMTGIDFLKALRSNSKYEKIPVLMVTAEAKKEQVVEAAMAGVNGYIVKPFTAETLKVKVDDIFKKLKKV